MSFVSFIPSKKWNLFIYFNFFECDKEQKFECMMDIIYGFIRPLAILIKSQLKLNHEVYAIASTKHITR